MSISHNEYITHTCGMCNYQLSLPSLTGRFQWLCPNCHQAKTVTLTTDQEMVRLHKSRSEGTQKGRE
jgi:predicted RNA-binding Zn-ribbon protein involved in translation (DUF1610 family)